MITEVGEVLSVKVIPEPEITVHNPVPTIGLLAARVVVVVPQSVWSGPALEVVGAGATSTETGKDGPAQPLELYGVTVYVTVALAVVVLVNTSVIPVLVVGVTTLFPPDTPAGIETAQVYFVPAWLEEKLMPVCVPLHINGLATVGVIVGVAGMVTVNVNGIPGQGLALLIGVMV